jgi:hypothetical protein
MCRNTELRLVGQQRRRLGQGRALGGQHGVDEQAVAARGGDAAGGGVGAGDQAEVFQVGHHVAHGGRRQLDAGGARKCARANRLAVGYVPFHQGFEQQLGAVIEHARILGERHGVISR